MAKKIVIIGGGTAGIGAARAARVLGLTPVLVTDGPIGGDCTFTGCVPSKSLIAAARHGLSFDEATVRMRATIDEIASEEDAAALRSEGIVVVEGRATIDAVGRVDVGGSRLDADEIIVATGAKAAVPPIPGIEEVPFRTNETIFDLDALPIRLAVLGAGPIGCELSLAFARFGSTVHLFEREGRVLPGEEQAVSDVIDRSLTRAGVEAHVGTDIMRLGRRVDGSIEVVADGLTVVVDELLVATGRTPNTAGLGLTEVGVSMNARGHIEVDGRLQTSVTGIRAAGDVTGLLPFTHAADEQARMAVAHAVGKGARWRYDASSTPWVTFTAPEVARVGVIEADAPRGAMVAELPLSCVDRALTDDATDGFVKLIAAPKRLTRSAFGGRLVGATIVADRAGEMIHGPALAARTGMFVGRLAQTTVAYPTWSTAIQQAAGQFFQPVNGLAARPAVTR